MDAVPAGLSQSDVVVFGIKRSILNGELGPGSRLPIEKDLALSLGVSRSSLREGVRALSIMGVLETRQGAGTFVTSLDAALLIAPIGFLVDLQHGNGVAHLHSVRRVLETEAVGEAAMLMEPDELQRARELVDLFEEAINQPVMDHDSILGWDIEFHRVIATASRNPVLSALIDALASRTARARLWRAIADDRSELATLAEHRSILLALADRSPERARLRMANHLLSVEDFLRARPPADIEGDGA